MFEHKTVNAVKLAAVISHQLSVVEADQKLAQLKLLTSAELFKNELLFLCYQCLLIVSHSWVCLCHQSQGVNLLLNDDKF